MKRMNNLKNVIAAKIMGGLVIGMAAVAGVSPVTVFAQSQEAECICDEKCSQDSINEECAVCLYDYNVCQGVDAHIEDSEECTETAEENYGPLTPDGNMNLVDDYGSIEAGGKQFITVTTKSGNYFYIIIDRDDKGTETVHFLNLVDESDLLKLMEDDEVESYMNSQGMTASEKEKEEVKSTEATEEISEEPKEEAKALETGKKVLIVLPEKNETVYRSARNIKGVKTTLVSTLNVYDILNCDSLVVLKDAVSKIEEVYA